MTRVDWVVIRTATSTTELEVAVNQRIEEEEEEYTSLDIRLSTTVDEDSLYLTAVLHFCRDIDERAGEEDEQDEDGDESA